MPFNTQASAGQAGSQQGPPTQQGGYVPSSGYSPSQIPNNPPQQQHQGVMPQNQQAQQQAQQQQAQQPQAPQPQQGQGQQSGGVQLADDTILDGPSVPPELRGRTFGQVKRVYQALANNWIQQQRGQQQQQQGQQPQGQQQRQPQQQPRQQNRQDYGGYYNQDDDDTQDQQGQQGDQSLQAQIRRAVEEAVTPLRQASYGNATATAREHAKQNIPDFNELEGDIMQQLNGASAEALANPQVWEAAADLVRGRRIRSQQYQQGMGGQQGQQHQSQQGPRPGQRVQYPGPEQAQQNQQQFQQPVQQPQQAQPYQPQMNGGSVAANAYNLPQHQFFTEGPSAPAPQGQPGLTPVERAVAQKMGMSPQEYIAWKQGGAR